MGTFLTFNDINILDHDPQTLRIFLFTICVVEFVLLKDNILIIISNEIQPWIDGFKIKSKSSSLNSNNGLSAYLLN